MTTQHRFSGRLRSIFGGALVGLGLRILFGNLDRDAAHLRHLLGSTQAFGVLPSVVLASSEAAKAYALDHHSFGLGLLRLLVSFWPLILVVAGTVFLREAVGEKVKALPKPARHLQNKDSGCRFCCPSFDA